MMMPSWAPNSRQTCSSRLAKVAPTMCGNDVWDGHAREPHNLWSRLTTCLSSKVASLRAMALLPVSAIANQDQVSQPRLESLGASPLPARAGLSTARIAPCLAEKHLHALDHPATEGSRFLEQERAAWIVDRVEYRQLGPERLRGTSVRSFSGSSRLACSAGAPRPAPPQRQRVVSSSLWGARLDG